MYRSEVKSNGNLLILKGAGMKLRGRTGAIFLYKHPTHPDAVTLFLRADDEVGMENILRLFPTRTGVFGPDWMAISPDTMMLGAAGVTGAGYDSSEFYVSQTDVMYICRLWADGWEYCETSSWTV
jgi:hypothetical protein